MDCAPFKKPSRLAGLFSYRSVIPPSPRETLLRKLSWGPRPPCRAANVQAVYRLRRFFAENHRALILLLLASPRNFALQIFAGALAALSGGKRASVISLATIFLQKVIVRSFCLLLASPPCQAAAHCAPFKKSGRLAGLSLSFSFRSSTSLAARAFPGENAHGSTALLAHLCRHSQLRGAVFV